MKTLKTILIALSMVLCAGAASAAKGELKPNEAEVTFKSNFQCEACKAKIEKNIPFEKGFVDMNVSLADNTIYLKFDSRKTSVEKMKKAIEKLGYKAEVVEGGKAEEKK